MPPKQKEVKKGPTYKPAAPSKDLVPADIKEPPREPRPLRIPDSFPEPPKNNEPLSALFEDWPAEEVLKNTDFGLHATTVFQDPGFPLLLKYFEDEAVTEWRRFGDVEAPTEQEGVEEEKGPQSQSRNRIESFKSLQSENQHGDKGPHLPCVIETFLRPENEQEMEARLKEEAERAEKAAKDKKKAAKKEQPKEEGPVQVSDVMMADIVTAPWMARAAVWIGSQLQVIKQRNLNDVNTGEPVWRKIYPQQNGVPQLTKSGKYWVKLLHMGKYVKVEVDDRVPLSQDLREMFPISQKHNQKWTLILCKAVSKLLATVSTDPVVGSGLVLYALTGMLAQTVPLHHFKDWEHLENLMSNAHYQHKDVVVACFGQNPQRPLWRQTRVRIQGQGEEEWHEEQVETGLLDGFAYCVGDYFDNGVFHMGFSQEKSSKEMALKQEYNEMCKVSLTNKTRQEKLEYRRKKKELKERLAAQQKKRLQLISRPASRHHFLKLLAPLRLECEYGEREILLAKRCVLNRLSQPPNYDIPLQKQEKDTKSMHSVSFSVIKYKEDSELFPNIHDFSSVPNFQELLERKEEGTWIQDHDLLAFFDHLQVLYNPNVFLHKAIERVDSRKANAFTEDENKEILVVEKVDQEEEAPKTIRLLLGYGYQRSQHDSFGPYSLLQKFDFEALRATSQVVRLDKAIVSELIELKNQNSVFRLHSMSKGNYAYWISADAPFKLLSIADYLAEFQGYQKKTVSCEYPPIEARTYLPLLKLRLTYKGEGSNPVLVRLLGLRQELASSVSFRLVTSPAADEPSTSQTTEGIVRKLQQQTLLAHDYSRLSIQAGREQFLIVEANSAENVADGSFQLLLLSKNEGLEVESCETVEPIKYIEKYLPNKYGLICRDRLFTSSDCSASFVLRLAEFEEVAAAGGKGAKKGGKDEPSTELVDKPLSEERSILVRLLCNDKILYEVQGVNEVTIPHISLKNTKGDPSRQYYLVAEFDMRTWPQCRLRSQETGKLCWVAQVVSTDSVALVRDTRQEDKEKAIRKSWEDSEPGRADRAKKARRRFLIQAKQERGEELTEEELQIVSAPRLTRKQMQEEERRNEDKKGKGGKKDDKKAGKDVKKDEVPEDKPVERPLPKSQDNFTNEIRQFLKILENCVVRQQKLGSAVPRIRSQEEIGAIREGAWMSTENRVGQLIRNVERRETVKIKEREKKETLSIFFSEVKEQLKQHFGKYNEWRSEDAEKDRAKDDKERLLIDLLSQEKPPITETDLRKHLSEYSALPDHNPALAEVGLMLAKNLRIAALSERMAALTAGWEIEEMKAVAEEIKRDGIEGIEEEVLRPFRELLQEADKNPGLVAEKQAEAKKGKKGSKK